ncbi:SGNH/GDSL hydrolase family protein [Cohnella sp. AR92]|uniref:SGNH/GDSL hydrolase family protein n=1 Tax=Cohnella sp. AR92 TaxID=648716 RepID=UPI000F8F4B15|nr:SGNH/GDSL hydrolase family protein [Cohnella sp. AR92]RUS49004.1 GDSL family lipase [Cohnella sp. AR92]
MSANEKLIHYELSEIENVKIHGRTAGGRSPLALFWTGSAVEFNARGSELWIEIEGDYDQYEPWISILINSAPVGRQMVQKGKSWVCVFRGMNAEVVKNVRIVKDVQAMSGDPSHSLRIHGAKFDGEFLPVEDKPRRIEFIGDSITSGEGAIGAKPEEDWIPMWFSAIDNYAYRTAAALNADYRVLSQSGWGVMTSWDNVPRNNLPDYYEQVCGLLTGEKNAALGAHENHDFAAWQPDVVVVNLGTNDGGAFFNAAWTDPATGRVYKQRLNEDGSFNEEDLNAFEEAARNFLTKLRRNNPQAHIVWAYGMLGIPMMPAIHRAVSEYVRASGDRKVSVFQLPDMTEETVGARWHPGKQAHERAAAELTGYLRGLLDR